MPDGKENLMSLIHEIAGRSSIRRGIGHPTLEITHDEFEALSNAALLCMADNSQGRRVIPITESQLHPGGRM
jgi:hypothetical protein